MGEVGMIPYHNSCLGWTNEWYEKLIIEIPRVCHRYLNPEFIKKIYGDIIKPDEPDLKDAETEDPIDDDNEGGK